MSTAFAQNASAEDLSVLKAVQRPLRFSCMTVPTVGPVLWKKVPTWYLVAEQLGQWQRRRDRLDAVGREPRDDTRMII
jgi:hypothetical protein